MIVTAPWLVPPRTAEGPHTGESDGRSVTCARRPPVSAARQASAGRSSPTTDPVLEPGIRRWFRRASSHLLPCAPAERLLVLVAHRRARRYSRPRRVQ